MSNQSLPMDQAGFIVNDLVGAIRDQRDYLSEIDAAIGDGDHGINMAKGFTQCNQRLAETDADNLVVAMDALSQSLLEGIGGSMGPLYGSFFMAFGEALDERAVLDAEGFGIGLREGADSIQMLGEAQVGDKTLLDTLMPATQAYDARVAEQAGFTAALAAMTAAAQTGRDSTRDLQARIGRAARLGERSIGVLDAGAVSCCLILTTMADSITQRLSVAA